MAVIDTAKPRNLYLANQVDQTSINLLTKEIIEINENDEFLKGYYKLYNLVYEPNPIKIYIDSYGGYVYQCFGLLSIMEASKTPIHTIVTGCAMSCGFMIAITGHRRFGHKKSTYLYHQVSGGTDGKVKDMEEELEETKRLQQEIENNTVEKTNISKKRLQEVYLGKKDWFITTNEALTLKIIDEVI